MQFLLLLLFSPCRSFLSYSIVTFLSQQHSNSSLHFLCFCFFILALSHPFLTWYVSAFCKIQNTCHHFYREDKKSLKFKTQTYQCEKSDSKQHGEISERVLEVYQDITLLSRPTVIEQGERQAIEVAEAVLVRMVAMVPSVLTVHPQVPLTCRHTERWSKVSLSLCEIFNFKILHTVFLSL